MTKQSILLSVVVVIILGSLAFFALNKQNTPTAETVTPISTTDETKNDTEQDLNQIDSTNFDKDFENIDKDINGL